MDLAMAQTEDARIEAAPREPGGELCIRTLAMPADTNQNGDIFGGWVLGQMDIAGGIFASKTAKGRCVTIAVDAMTFRKPVYLADGGCVYADLRLDYGERRMIAVGRSGLRLHVMVFTRRAGKVRIISLRKANDREIRRYEEFT